MRRQANCYCYFPPWLFQNVIVSILHDTCSSMQGIRSFITFITPSESLIKKAFFLEQSTKFIGDVKYGVRPPKLKCSSKAQLQRVSHDSYEQDSLLSGKWIPEKEGINSRREINKNYLVQKKHNEKNLFNSAQERLIIISDGLFTRRAYIFYELNLLLEFFPQSSIIRSVL